MFAVYDGLPPDGDSQPDKAHIRGSSNCEPAHSRPQHYYIVCLLSFNAVTVYNNRLS